MVAGFFTGALLVSGLTAFPLQWEVGLMSRVFGIDPGTSADAYQGIYYWIAFVQEGLTETHEKYPFIGYGTDWLAFAHIVIAIAFIGPVMDPVKNVWVVNFGLIACVLVIPLALICGPIRGIPFYWQLMDCSFGVFGFIPLWICRKYILELTPQIPGSKTALGNVDEI